MTIGEFLKDKKIDIRMLDEFMYVEMPTGSVKVINV